MHAVIMTTPHGCAHGEHECSLLPARAAAHMVSIRASILETPQAQCNRGDNATSCAAVCGAGVPMDAALLLASLAGAVPACNADGILLKMQQGLLLLPPTVAADSSALLLPVVVALS